MGYRPNNTQPITPLVLKVEPLASATEDEIVVMVAPAIQAALTTPLPPAASRTP